MRGAYKLIINNSKIKYELDIRHGINIIKGNSGTGKTTLYTLALKVEDGVGGYKSNYKDKIRVLTRRSDWYSVIQKSHNCFIFADETIPYIYSKEFASLAQNSDNYFIINTRRNLDCLVYSADAVYRLKAHYKEFKNTIENIYGDNQLDNYKPDIVLCEDKNSGYEMFKEIFNIHVESADGKDGITKFIENNIDKKIYAIADGSGFGNCVNEVLRLRDRGFTNFQIYLPRSFEYLVLNYSKFSHSIQDELNNTENYCDTTEFKSWERYYTYLLEQVCMSYGFKYSKSKLSANLKFDEMYDTIKLQLKDISKEVFK